MVDTRENNFSNIFSSLIYWIQNVNEDQSIKMFLKTYKKLVDQNDSYLPLNGQEIKISDIINVLKLPDKLNHIFTSLLKKIAIQQRFESTLVEDFEFFLSSGDVEKSYIIQARFFETSSTQESTTRR